MSAKATLACGHSLNKFLANFQVANQSQLKEEKI
jgi:hypothetical protein